MGARSRLWWWHVGVQQGKLEVRSRVDEWEREKVEITVTKM